MTSVLNALVRHSQIKYVLQLHLGNQNKAVKLCLVSKQQIPEYSFTP